MARRSRVSCASGGSPFRRLPAYCARWGSRVGPASRLDRDAYLPLLRRCAGARRARSLAAWSTRPTVCSRPTAPVDKRSVEARAEARYAGQSYELPIAFDYGDAAWGRLAADFHAAHRNRLATPTPRRPSRSSASVLPRSARSIRPSCPGCLGSSTPPAEAGIGTRRVFFEGRDPGDAGAGRRPGAGARQAAGGNKIAGPAVIEEISATTVLYPGDRAEVHASGVLLVECPA